MSKEVFKSSEIDSKTIDAVNLLTDPIKQTMSPMGGNVMYEDEVGASHYTNDGATIAKNLYVDDPIMNQTIQIMKSASLTTNANAGDGTSSTILLSSILIKEGLKLIEKDWNPTKIRDAYNKFGEDIKNVIKKSVTEISGDKDMFYIANVSSSNDKEIADNTVKTIKITGKDGQVMINQGFSEKTEIIEDTGFIIPSGIFLQELAHNNALSAKYDNIPVLITDKRLYYEAEAEKILSTILENGYESVVIVASDFIGEALPYLVENHQRGKVNVLLIKEPRPEILSDLAVYLDGEVVSDKSGNIDNLSIDNFVMSKMVFSNTVKSIISRDKGEKNSRITQRVKELKAELESNGNKDSEQYKALEGRIACLTNGMVTIKVGGRTIKEINEKIFRYEDAINATRASLDGGYVVGGGLALYNGWKNLDKKNINTDFVRVFDRYAKSIFNQISINCGVNEDVNQFKLEEVQDEFGDNWGFNAVKEKMSDMLKDGIIEPYKVVSQAIDNSISVANIILTSRYRIINKIKNEEKK